MFLKQIAARPNQKPNHNSADWNIFHPSLLTPNGVYSRTWVNMNIGELISGVKAGYCACENKDGPKLEVHCTTHHHPPRDGPGTSKN